MLQKTVGIVLHTLKYNDTSNIVDIYTRENGRAFFLVSVPRSRKSAVKTVLFQPLSMIEFEAIIVYVQFVSYKRAKSWHLFARCPTILINLQCHVLGGILYPALRKKRKTGRFCLFGHSFGAGQSHEFPHFHWFPGRFQFPGWSKRG